MAAQVLKHGQGHPVKPQSQVLMHAQAVTFYSDKLTNALQKYTKCLQNVTVSRATLQALAAEAIRKSPAEVQLDLLIPPLDVYEEIE